MNLNCSLRWGLPATMLVAGSTFAASPSIDGMRDSLYDASPGGAFDTLVAQQASVIEVFSDPFALELQADNSNVGGVGPLAATNFQGEPADVETGFELEIPLNEIGWDGSSQIKICAIVNGGGSDFLSNQVSGGYLAGTQIGDGFNPGFPPYSWPPFDFDDAVSEPAVTGNQFVTVTNVQSGVSMTIDGVADEAEWDDNSFEPLLYVNGVANPPSGTENPTSFADNNDPDVFFANGSEINAVRAFRTSSSLYLHISGNMESNFNKLDIFIDCDAAGPNQNPLPSTASPGYAGLGAMADSVFDAGFAPDYYLRFTRGDCGGGTPCQFLDAVDLDNAGVTGSQNPFVDTSTPISFVGPSPFGGTINAQFDNSNVGGITGPGGGDGVDVAFVTDPATVTTGVEFSIDLDALGWNGSDDILIGGFLAEGDQMSNQVIGGVPSDTGQIGPADGVDFNTIAGDQYVTLTAAQTGAAPTIDGSTAGDAYFQIWVNDVGGTGNSTTLGDATSGGGPDVDPMASEIDGLYAVIESTGGENTLYCLVSGNFGNYNKLGIFFDTKTGGQNTIRNDNPDVSGNFYNNLSPMVWDTAFVPDFSIVYNLGTNNGPDEMPGGGDDFVEHFVDGVELATNGAEDQPAGGPFDGGVKDINTNLAGDLVSRFGFGNNTLTAAEGADLGFANGSELDNVSAFVDSTYLYVFIGGNIESNFTKGQIFFDIIPEVIGDPQDPDDNYGGQNTLVYSAEPPLDDMGMPNPNYDGNCDLDFQGLNRMGGPFIVNEGEPDEFTQPGFTFDAGFTADHAVYFTVGGDDPLFPGEPEWFGGSQRLRDALPEDPATPGAEDPGECNFWGGTSFSDGGDFSFDNPGETAFLYVDNTNVLGVSGGPDQFQPDDSAPATVTTGIEIAIPLEEILVPDPVNPTTAPPVQWDGNSDFKMMVMINGGFYSFVSNQFLQPVCAQELGEPREINLETDHPGLQFMELTPNGTPPMVSYSKISADPDPCVGGACCFNDGSCNNLTEADCLAAGGTYQGDNTTCETTTCPVQGACCLPGGSCVTAADQAECENVFGGTYQGDGTDCATVDCASGGACCFSCPDTNVCTEEVDAAACLALGGVYIGDGTTCGATNCADYCQADLDGDGDVDVFDFGVFGPNFGSVGVTRCQGDFDCDGDVDVFDFGVFGPDFGCSGLLPAAGCP